MKNRYVLVRTRWIGILAFIVLATSSIARVRAADRAVLADASCVVVAMHMATLNNPQQRSTGVMLAIYYLGRLDGHSLGADTERLIEEEAGKMTPAELRSDALRCGKALASKGQEMARIGAALVRKGQGGVPPK